MAKEEFAVRDLEPLRDVARSPIPFRPKECVDAIPEGPRQFDLFGVPIDGVRDKKDSVVHKRKRTRRKMSVETQLELFEQLLEASDDEIETEPWTEDDIISMREFMFRRHFRLIADRRTKEDMLREVWEWILSDDIHPFSFLVCLDSMAKQTGQTLEFWDLSLNLVCPDEVRWQAYAYAQRYGTWHEFCLLTHRP